MIECPHCGAKDSLKLIEQKGHFCTHECTTCGEQINSTMSPPLSIFDDNSEGEGRSNKDRDIDRVFARVRMSLPAARMEQLKVAHPGTDDDGLWFFSLPNTKSEVQVESPTGDCPFLIENDFDNERRELNTVEEVASSVVEYLSRITKT
jgi:hypothetical protein